MRFRVLCKLIMHPLIELVPVHRIYNEMLKLRHVWRLGGPADGSRYSIDLGETAVDFDFGAPRLVQDVHGAAGLLDESQVSVGRTHGVDVS